jgi:hypothetical protein
VTSPSHEALPRPGVEDERRVERVGAGVGPGLRGLRGLRGRLDVPDRLDRRQDLLVGVEPQAPQPGLGGQLLLGDAERGGQGLVGEPVDAGQALVPSTASVISAPSNMAPGAPARLRSAPVRSASLRSAPPSVASDRIAPTSVASAASASLRSASLSVASVRSVP